MLILREASQLQPSAVRLLIREAFTAVMMTCVQPVWTLFCLIKTMLLLH
jgi:hypothetical protein